MEGLLLFAFMAVVFAGLYSLLAFGYRSMEANRAKSEKAEAASRMPVLQEPRFFAKTMEKPNGDPVPLVPVSLVSQLEQRLQLEYEGAALFASQPSKERICSGYGAYVDAVAGDLEARIQRESAATKAFVAEPSLKRLYT